MAKTNAIHYAAVILAACVAGWIAPRVVHAQENRSSACAAPRPEPVPFLGQLFHTTVEQGDNSFRFGSYTYRYAPPAGWTVTVSPGGAPIPVSESDSYWREGYLPILGRNGQMTGEMRFEKNTISISTYSCGTEKCLWIRSVDIRAENSPRQVATAYAYFAPPKQDLTAHHQVGYAFPTVVQASFAAGDSCAMTPLFGSTAAVVVDPPAPAEERASFEQPPLPNAGAAIEIPKEEL